MFISQSKKIIKKMVPIGWLKHVLRNVILHLNFQSEYDRFRKMTSLTKARFSLRWEDRDPCLNDKNITTNFDRHYVYHPAWASRVLAKTKPKIHIDISSSLYFCSIISAFIPVKFYDLRPANLQLDNLSSEPVDLLALPFPDESLQSVSCMHVIEHIGLGRYGDPLDPDGDLKAISEIKRVLALGGTLLFVVPIGKPKIMFNAHRIYSYDQIYNYFSELKLVEFALIPDDPKEGGLMYNVSKELVDAQNYGCGCFWFQKN